MFDDGPAEGDNCIRFLPFDAEAAPAGLLKNASGSSKPSWVRGMSPRLGIAAPVRLYD